MGWGPADLLPAAWVLLIAGAAFAALARWFEPVPRRVAIAVTALVVAALAPALVGGGVLLPLGALRGGAPFHTLPPPPQESIALQWDQLTEITPWQHVVREALHAGRWPLWNAHAGAGMPLLADPQSQAVQPLVLAALPLPLAQAVGVIAALRILLAMIGMALLLRAEGAGESSTLVGAVAFGLSGMVILWLGWPLATSAAAAPLLVYAVLRCLRHGGRRDHALLLAAVVIVLAAGHPETELYVLALAAVVAIAEVSARRVEGWAAVVTPLVRLAAVVGLAALLLAPALLLQQQFLPLTERSLALRWEFRPLPITQFIGQLADPAVRHAWRQRVEPQLLSMLAPRAFGDWRAWWGATHWVEDGSGCVGVVVLTLALAGVGRGRTRWRHERTMWLLLAAAMLLLAQPPDLGRVIGRLPVIGPTALHKHHRLVLVVALALAYLAAAEVERWRRGGWRWRSLAGAGLVAAAFCAWAYMGHPPPASASVAGLARPAFWLAAQLGLLVVAAGVLALAASRDGRAREGALAALALVVAGELLLLHGSALRAAPRPLFFPATPPLRFLQEHLGADRFVGIGSLLSPNEAQMFGLDDVRVEGPSRPYDYSLVIEAVRPAWATDLGSYSLADRPADPLYDLLGVRYFLAAPDAQLGAFECVHRSPEGAVFARDRWLPRIFLPRASTRFAGRMWRTWLRNPHDYEAHALVSYGPERWRAERPRWSELRIVRLEPARIAARAHLVEPRLLASSVLQDGNWRLLLDGRPAPTALVDGPFVGAWLPAGEHTVELLYRPRALLVGCVASAVAATLACCWLLPPPRRREPAAAGAPATMAA